MTKRTIAGLVQSIALALFMLPLVHTAAEGAELAEKIELCIGCHGGDGMPAEPDTPIIAGQEFYYIYVQLRDYKAGRRSNDIMGDIVADLSKEEMQALATHFSKQTWPAIAFRTDDAVIGVANSAVASGQCTQCHLGSFIGDSRIPRLAGQQRAYLERTMLEFKSKVRLNAPDKGTLFASFKEGDIAALADYLAGR